jgi:formylglycine-generating enzyme required for sulfatase activity
MEVLTFGCPQALSLHARISRQRLNSNDQPQPVGLKLPNAWELYDMLGNVFEWCHDEGHVYKADAVIDPMGPTATGTARAFRGGSWKHSAALARAAGRTSYISSLCSDAIGFRCACSGRRR